MKSKLIKCLFILIIGAFALFNVYQFQLKNKGNLVSYNLLLQTKDLINSVSFAEGILDFPEDSYEGENLGEDGYARRKVFQYYHYYYIDLYKEINGEEIYAGYKTPTTKVVCEGLGKVACYSGEYTGFTEALGEVKESEKKQNVFE